MWHQLKSILEQKGFDPDLVVFNGQTALEYLEGAVVGAMDVIEMAQPTEAEEE